MSNASRGFSNYKQIITRNFALLNVPIELFSFFSFSWKNSRFLPLSSQLIERALNDLFPKSFSSPPFCRSDFSDILAKLPKTQQVSPKPQPSKEADLPSIPILIQKALLPLFTRINGGLATLWFGVTSSLFEKANPSGWYYRHLYFKRGRLNQYVFLVGIAKVFFVVRKGKKISGWQ